MATSWTDGEYDAVDRISDMALDEENAEIILDAFTSMPADKLLQIVLQSHWTVQQITRLCRVNRRWNERFCGAQSVAIWQGLLLRDFNFATVASRMHNRTAGAAAAIARSMREHVFADGSDAGVAERSRLLYRALYQFVFSGKRLPFAQQPSVDFPEAVVAKLAEQLGDRESRDPSAELYLEVTAKPDTHTYVYENGFIVMKPCFTGAATALYLLTDAVQYVFNAQLLADVILAGQYARGPQHMRFRRGDDELTRYDTLESRHPPLVIDGGGTEWRVWPRVTVPAAPSGNTGPESIPIDGFALDLQAIPGGQSPFLFWYTNGRANEQGQRVVMLASVEGEPTKEFALDIVNDTPRPFGKFLSLTPKHAFLRFDRMTGSNLVLADLDENTYSSETASPYVLRDMIVSHGGIVVEAPDTVVTFVTGYRRGQINIILQYWESEDMNLLYASSMFWSEVGPELDVVVAGKHLFFASPHGTTPVVVRIKDDNRGATVISYPAGFSAWPRIGLRTDNSITATLELQPEQEEAQRLVNLARGRNHSRRIECDRQFTTDDYEQRKESTKRQRVRNKLNV